MPQPHANLIITSVGMERASQFLVQTSSLVIGLYGKLRRKKEEFRLVSIGPGTAQYPLKCTLWVTSFSEHYSTLDYQALSYTWGDPSTTKDIFLNERPFQITNNLYTALHRLRCPNRSRTVWIDAICINQNDVDERNQQVKMMRKIYLLASEVLVFLDDFVEGTDIYSHQELHDPFQSVSLSSRDPVSVETPLTLDPGSNWELKAVCLLHLLASTGDEAILDIPVFQPMNESKAETSELPNELKKIAAWFSSNWWSRVWVVQEVTVPEHARLICGAYLVPWVTVASAAANLYRSSLRHDSISIANLPPDVFEVMRNLFTHVLELESTRMVRSHGRDLGILEVMWMYRHRRASDDRDHIYGLIGLLPGHFKIAGIVPQYELEALETYTTVTASLLRTSRSLVSLIGTWIRAPDQTDLPSWVHDWGYSWPDEPYSGLHQFLALQNHFTACCESFNKTRSGRGAMPFGYPIGYRLDGSVLYLRGAEVDVIHEVGRPIHKSTTEKDGNLRDTLHGWLKLARSLSLAAADDSFSQGFVEAFWRTIRFDLEFLDQGKILGIRGPQVFQRLLNFNLPDAESLPMRMQDMDPADFSIVKLLTLGRRFFVTKSGRMGLGPYSTLPGDRVFVLWGGDVPFILRASSREPHHRENLQDARETCHALVGDCYIHGVMDGGRENWGREQLIHLH